ncbi:hypothetical protein Ddye_011280 [Dipteronia dyeriana]|uniref:Uncharacterized protein n=1 Tax=Dipteronia dyeriana TaxID=168575 RepID=A0AAD9X286_9ROSI|nr:hypothetical protein Ddye_011280 [Dipteronia dyeriana]
MSSPKADRSSSDDGDFSWYFSSMKIVALSPELQRTGTPALLIQSLGIGKLVAAVSHIIHLGTLTSLLQQIPTKVGTNFVQGSSLFSFLINTLDLDLEPSQYVNVRGDVTKSCLDLITVVRKLEIDRLFSSFVGAIMTAIHLVVTATLRNSHLYMFQEGD